MDQRFYQDGLQFDCTRCQRCCRIEPGYVFLSERDLERLVAATGLTRDELIATACRTVDEGGFERLSLIEQPNLDCVFWEDGGCSVYDARPLQCESFPFWETNLGSHISWMETAESCPGVGRGPARSAAEIDYWLGRRTAEPYVGE